MLVSILVLLAAIVSPAQADWEYVRGQDGKKGTLTLSHRGGVDYVSVRQFCYAMSCRVFYQWANHRAIVQNPEYKTGAILSSLTRVALVDGKVLGFEGRILSDRNEGYLLPVGLASKLSGLLRLGKLVFHENEPVERSVDRGSVLERIVLDPGHGGSDLGTNFGGISEKDVAVLYAMKLRDELKKELPDLEVLLTRDDDRYVSLPDRAKFANAKSANLFLSLHVNHARDDKVEGVETYILSPDATDDEAKRLALMENDTWLKSAKIAEAGDAIRRILVDMEQTKYIQDSALTAAMIQQEFGALDKTHGLKSRGVKQAMFYVLSQVAMPATLVEMGFLSNTGDRGRLMDVVFRDEFVKRLVTALKRYRDKTRFKNAQ